MFRIKNSFPPAKEKTTSSKRSFERKNFHTHNNIYIDSKYVCLCTRQTNGAWGIPLPLVFWAQKNLYCAVSSTVYNGIYYILLPSSSGSLWAVIVSFWSDERGDCYSPTLSWSLSPSVALNVETALCCTLSISGSNSSFLPKKYIVPTEITWHWQANLNLNLYRQIDGMLIRFHHTNSTE